MVRAPAANRQAVKENPNASARPGLDAETPSAGSAAAAISLLRIGMVTPRLTLEKNRLLLAYLPAWFPSRAASPLAFSVATDWSPGVVAEATVIFPCSRSKA